MIYLDNAATSWPKPRGVAEAMVHFLDQIGANPGWSGHRLSVEAGRIVYDACEAVAGLLHAPDPLRVVFGANATEALNLSLQGYLRSGDHIVPLLPTKPWVHFLPARCALDWALSTHTTRSMLPSRLCGRLLRQGLPRKMRRVHAEPRVVTIHPRLCCIIALTPRSESCLPYPCFSSIIRWRFAVAK
jgi:hypothetical protein